MRRQYLAGYDDGHDFGEFTYYSKYRNNSKNNMHDCKVTFIARYGYERFKQITITYTQRYEGC